MDQMDKPFKTIEVVDSRTSQLCKVACMSCIRGHRTTSCGIPVCRSKVFWTVKRPGRPSNSCTCRYGGGGGCKCVVVSNKTTCPHKAKKGEKRSGECRCDEQGRYCCLIEPDHWSALIALQKPTVLFFPTREALEVQSVAPLLHTLPATSTYLAASPQQLSTIVPTASLDGIHPLRGLQGQLNGTQTAMRSPLGSRFQMMGIGTAQGSEAALPDALAWDGQVQSLPHSYQPNAYQSPPPQQEEPSSCCQGPSPPLPQVQPLSQYIPPHPTGHISGHQTPFDPFEDVLQNASIPARQTPAPAPFDYNKMTSDYYSYQLPNAICQNCGLSGCTCKHCPPVLQNFSNGSWAQCCGRKHARTLPPAAPQPASSEGVFVGQFVSPGASTFSPQQFDDIPHFVSDIGGSPDLAVPLSSAPTSEFPTFDLGNDVPMSINGSPPLSISDFLMSEPEDFERDQLMDEDEVGETCGCDCGS